MSIHPNRRSILKLGVTSGVMSIFDCSSIFQESGLPIRFVNRHSKEHSITAQITEVESSSVIFEETAELKSDETKTYEDAVPYEDQKALARAIIDGDVETISKEEYEKDPHEFVTESALQQLDVIVNEDGELDWGGAVI